MIIIRVANIPWWSAWTPQSPPCLGWSSPKRSVDPPQNPPSPLPLRFHLNSTLFASTTMNTSPLHSLYPSFLQIFLPTAWLVSCGWWWCDWPMSAWTTMFRNQLFLGNWCSWLMASWLNCTVCVFGSFSLSHAPQLEIFSVRSANIPSTWWTATQTSSRCWRAA